MGQQIRNARLRKVFVHGSHRQFDAKLARICVLFEDLRIEMAGISERSLPALDVLDPEKENWLVPEQTGKYRQFYFVRRSLVTLREFAEALRLVAEDVDHDPDLHRTFVVATDDEVKVAWTSAIQFFKVNERLLNEIRNDIGGHFGQKASLHAVSRLLPDAQGSIAVVDGEKLKLHFALEIAGTALMEHLPGRDIAEFRTLLEVCLLPGYQHATDSVYALVGTFLWDRFRS